ncbi:hypothetical protein CDL15_Pgr013272 [Punica granatum]|nr:hypothetical protein CDL15_Pgr013272 [Punica granatum]
MRRAAARPDSSDNYFHIAMAIDDLDLLHFQSHLKRGQLTMVRDVLATTFRQSRDPMVMERAMRQVKHMKHGQCNEVQAIDSLDGCEVPINIHQFFAGFTTLQFDARKWPQLLKLKDWPPSSLSNARLPRHGAKFVACLPFKEYTHPDEGPLNISIHLHENTLKPDMGPKAHIGYGVEPELGAGIPSQNPL